MKPTLWFSVAFLLLISSLTLRAQTETLEVLEAGPDDRLVQLVREEVDAAGTVFSITNQYTEVASGLNFWDVDSNSYQPSVPEFSIIGSEAVADQGQVNMTGQRSSVPMTGSCAGLLKSGCLLTRSTAHHFESQGEPDRGRMVALLPRTPSAFSLPAKRGQTPFPAEQGLLGSHGKQRGVQTQRRNSEIHTHYITPRQKHLGCNGQQAILSMPTNGC